MSSCFWTPGHGRFQTPDISPVDGTNDSGRILRMSSGHSVFYGLDRTRRLRIFSAKLPGYTFLVGTRLLLGDGAETVQPIPHLLSSVGISLSCPHLWLSGKRSAEEIPELGGGFHGCEPNGEISAESIIRRDPSDLNRASLRRIAKYPFIRRTGISWAAKSTRAERWTFWVERALRFS